MRKQIFIVVLLILALRLSFLDQAIQGDDIYYLYGAEHAQIDPLHPNHAQYPFLGQIVDMRGHPHPPLNAWILGALLALFQDVEEVRFHSAYILFSLIAGVSTLALARRFSPHPLISTLLFLVTPAFVVNGNSLESDLPFVAFWLLSIALFVTAVDRRSVNLLAASSVSMAFTAMSAYQAVVLLPILFLYGRKWRTSWIAALTPAAVFLVWQAYERFSTGALPVGILAGYMQSYGLQAWVQKLKNAVALTGHLAWLVFPALWIPGLLALPLAIGAAFVDPNPLFWGSIAIGAGILIWCAGNWRDFLAQWVLIFFACALVIFFAGSARYLLPIAAPVAILATRRIQPKWLYAGLVCELALSLGLATVNYQHWNGYREFAHRLKNDAESRKVWINGEWGLRFYFESEGALPIMQGHAVHPGETVVSSSLAYPLQFTTGGGMLTKVAEREITSPISLRLVALGGKSAYSTTLSGLRPFDISTGPIDRVRAETVISRTPVLSDLLMNSPEAEQQIVSGIFPLEQGRFRWMGEKAVVVLKSPGPSASLVVGLFIPDQARGRTVTAFVNGQRVAQQVYSSSGSFTFTAQGVAIQGDSATVTIAIDRTFSPVGDPRQLGIVLTEVGLRQIPTR